MSGINEILLIGAILLAILFLPRLKSRKHLNPPKKLTVIIPGKMRLAMAASVFWPVLTAAFLQPWKKDFVLFLYVGIGPVLFGWALFWVWCGFWKHHR